MFQISGEILTAIQNGLVYGFCLIIVFLMLFAGPILSVIGVLLTCAQNVSVVHENKIRLIKLYSWFEDLAIAYYVVVLFIIVCNIFINGIVAWVPALCAIAYVISSILLIDNKTKPFVSIITAFVYSGFMISTVL